MKKIILSTLVAGVILFMWSGFTQMLPWGVPSAQNVIAQSQETTKQTESPNAIRLEPNSLTSDEFDAQFLEKISIYSTDDTYSWIITNPIRSDYSGYFIGEILTQLLIGLLLSLILSLTVNLKLRTRMMLIALIGVCATIGTYGQLINWWGLPLSYGLGVSINLIIGWFIASFVIAKFILKTNLLP